MTSDHERLFERWTLNNGIEVPGRIAVAPITLYCSNPDGSVSEAERGFLQGRAAGIGLYVLGATLVADNGQGFPGQPRAIRESDLPALRERARIVKVQGALAIAQIHHAGILGRREFLPQGRVVGPSADGEKGAEPLSAGEVEALVQAFANAARLCIEAGYDGVEIHGANQYLIQQFYSAKTNQRTDAWGGSLEKRMRFPLAVTDAVLAAREAAGRPDFIVGYRLSPEEPGEGGITMAETAALVRELKKRPLQYLHVSQKDFFRKARRGADSERARLDLIHEWIGGAMALVGVGDLFTGEDFDRALGAGWVDAVATARALMMNPALTTLIREGRDSEIEKHFDEAKAAGYQLPPVLYPRLPR